MLRFFRQIRSKLFTQNKFRAYFGYALGEVLLVMIGILLALQVNNWNAHRLERKQELNIIKSLDKELLANKDYLNSFLSEIQKIKYASIKLLNLPGNPEQQINPDTFYKWEIDLEDLAPFSPVISVLTELINSDQLQLVQNDALKHQLTKYKKQMEEQAATAKFRSDYWIAIQAPYFVNHGNRLKILRADSRYKDAPKSRFKVDIKTLLSDPKFENIAADIYWLTKYDIEDVNDTIQEVEETKNMIRQYYNLD